jgi:ABC-type phosphate/phosphonate transport system substrate-binding protein
MIKIYLFTYLLISSIFATSLLAMQKEYNFAIFAYRDKAIMQERYEPLINYLNQKLPNSKINLKILSIEEIDDAIDQNKIDFLLTSPAQYMRLKEKTILATPFATLSRYENGRQISSLGGLILTLKENQKINNLSDLKGKKISSPAKKFVCWICPPSL